MKRIIHIFLASSITDLKDDREAIGNFIRQMNNIYYNQDLYIYLHMCEDESEDHSMKKGGTQKSLDDEIRESDMCFVLFWHKAGDYTEHELQVALEGLKLNSNPKIEVYFKNLAEGESLTNDVRRVMEEIDQKFLHYHREYSHIDSLKLGVITQLQVHGFLRVDMKVENEQVTVSGLKVASTNNIPVYSQNEKYLKLVEKCREAEKECAKLLQNYSEDRNNKKLYFKYLSAIEERQRLQEELTKIANGILNIGREITKTISTSAPTERICEAIQCFDRGDYEGVLWILPPDEIDNYFIQANILEEKANMERQRGIDEYRIRILALEAQGKWPDVHKTYEHVIEQVEGCPAAPKTIMLEYARFLYRQKSYQESLDVCIKLQTALAQNPKAISEQETSELYDLQGELYFYTMKFEDAELYLQKAIELRKAAVEQGQEQDMQMAGTYVKLAKVYYEVTRFFEAEALYLQALELYKKYDTKAIEAVDVDIAHTSLGLGNLYYMINRHEDASKEFFSAYHKYTELVNSGEKRYTAAMAEASDRFAILEISVYSHVKVERYYVQAMKVKQVLTQKDPVTYFLFLERILKKLGQFWKENGEATYGDLILEEAGRIQSVIRDKTYADDREEYRALDYAYYVKPINKTLIEPLLQESRRVFKVLADENPEAYESSLAQAYNVTGVFYTQIGEKQNAEANYAEAITIRERQADREPALKPDLAASYSNLSQHYFIWDKYAEAKEYAKKAIDIYESVIKGETGAFNTHLARNYNAFANICVKAGDRKLAEEYYKKSMMLYIRLFEKSSRAYIDRIINTVNNIVTFFDPIGSAKWMEEFVDENKVGDWLQVN
jgi:tetratricopeptide (TPR) repeat protein